MDIATNLNFLIESHQLQDKVKQMPLLSIHHLKGHRELRLAHLALGVITMGYVWQEGKEKPAKTLPKGLAVPYCRVSEVLGLPPILVYADSVLANWKKKDRNGPMDIGNLDTVFTLPGGDTCKGFLLVSLMVEKAASSGLQGIAMAMNSMVTHDISSMEEALLTTAASLIEMREAFQLMHGEVDPTLFYGVLRTFLSGWKDNPMLPEGLRYEGVWEEPRHFSGGSAAQSSAIQCFDELLGIRHKEEHDASFLMRMREYMPPPHRRLIEAIAAGPALRQYVISSASARLSFAYNCCVAELVKLRSYHINTVYKYINIPANKAKRSGCPFGGTSLALRETGTGGSDVLRFLQSIRNSTKDYLIY
ncbi:indoleamine 2,3-dioxygenase 2-like isoform X2 [Lepisosteus oculatus]